MTKSELVCGVAPADAQQRLVKAAAGMAAAVFPDCTAALDAPLLALEQSTVDARRSQVGFVRFHHC